MRIQSFKSKLRGIPQSNCPGLFKNISGLEGEWEGGTSLDKKRMKSHVNQIQRVILGWILGWGTGDAFGTTGKTQM